MMNNKKGFTLVELLAVIAILAILVIVALPNIIKMYNQARIKSFENEVKNIYRTAQQQWLTDTINNISEKEYARCNSEMCPNQLKLNGGDGIEYYIRINGNGDIVEYSITNGSFQYFYTGNGLKIDDIDNVEVVDKNVGSDRVVISCGGNLSATSSSLFEYKIANNKVTITEYKVGTATYTISDVDACKANVYDSIVYNENDGSYDDMDEISLCETGFDNGMKHSMEWYLATGAISPEEYQNCGLSNVNINSSPKNVEIPSTIEGKPVVAIGNNAFFGNYLTSVTIPNNITSIGNQAFSNNQLTSVTIPENVISLGYSSFENNQLTSVTIEGKSSSYEFNTYQPVWGWKSNVTCVKDNKNNVRNGCVNWMVEPTDSSLFQYTISNNKVTIIGYEVGQARYIMGDVDACKENLYNSLWVYTNDDTAYDDVDIDSLCETGYDSGTGRYMEWYLASGLIMPSKYSDCGFEDVDIDKTSRDIIIPSIISGKPVVSIGRKAFYQNLLTSVTIPSSITTIGDYAFNDNLLTSVTIPNSVTSIGYGAFFDNQLNMLVIPSSITSIEGLAFYGNKLTSVTIPNSVTLIRNQAFSNNRLTSIIIPNSVTSIGEYAFSKNKLTSVTIPSSVMSIGQNAFTYNELTSVVIEGKSSSNDFTSYRPNWGWKSNVSCVKNNTTNVTNGCIVWKGSN